MAFSDYKELSCLSEVLDMPVENYELKSVNNVSYTDSLARCSELCKVNDPKDVKSPLVKIDDLLFKGEKIEKFSCKVSDMTISKLYYFYQINLLCEGNVEFKSWRKWCLDFFKTFQENVVQDNELISIAQCLLKANVIRTDSIYEEKIYALTCFSLRQIILRLKNKEKEPVLNFS